MVSTDNSIPVLLVEDDEIDVENVQRELKKANIPLDLHVAKNGIDALDIIYGRNGKDKLFPAPRAIIIDINMPKMNGIDFLKTLRTDTDFRRTNVFILTVSYNTHDKVATHDLNVTSYIVKPLQYEDIQRIYWMLIGTSVPPA